MPFLPSSYQQAIFDWIRDGSGHAIIDAVAGSGKTTTLVEASRHIHRGRLLFVAFNRHVVSTLQARLPQHAHCKTIHAIGYGCLARHFDKTPIHTRENKYRQYTRQVAERIHRQLATRFDSLLAQWEARGRKDDEMPEPPPRLEQVREQMDKLVHFVRCTLTNPDSGEEMQSMVAHFSIDCPVPLEKVLHLVRYMLDTGDQEARDLGVIDYTDMIWLPYRWKLQPHTYDWMLVDEAQDLNAAQLHLIRKMVGPATRMLFVGDPHQAIYGFSGADSRSFYTIRDELPARPFPLSICYRCPEKIVALAKTIVPQIEPRPGSPEGEITELKDDDILAHIGDRDLVLCRSTEPLVRLYFRLLARKKHVVIKGKDLGKALSALVQRTEEQDGFQFGEFSLYLDRYAQQRLDKLRQKPDNERQASDFEDQVNSVHACYQAFACASAPALRAELEHIFRDEGAAITLSTVHRAKGLEQDRVFILNYPKMPLIWGRQKPWEYIQELNLKYVAVTRAKQSLFLVSE